MNRLPERFESKYLLDQMAYRDLRAALAPVFRLDPYSRRAHRGRYLVRSLYFDTDDYRAYFEKITGENIRTKLRLRAYAATAEEAGFVNVEMKHRHGKMIHKETERIDLDTYAGFMKTGNWGDNDSPVLAGFEFKIKTLHQKPKVLVDYRREAFVSRTDSRIRISFDHRLSYAMSDRLFPSQAAFKSEMGRFVVFEIKVGEDDLELIHRMVREFDLKAVPNSKFANAIEHTQTTLWN